MTLDVKHIPYGISQYVTRQFREDFLFSCHKITTPKGKIFYDVEVSKDDITHQLMFDHEGKLIKESDEVNFPDVMDELDQQ
jgi:hypothetical protein